MDLENGASMGNIFPDLVFRPVEVGDHDQLKSIHDDLFPVKYSDRFFTEAVNGRGIRGGALYTLMALQDGVLVGFIMAQFLKSHTTDDAAELFESGEEPNEIFYILTLGLTKDFRRCGLGSELVRRAIDHARLNPDCGAIYLHVISYNLPALCFYEKNDFLCVKEVPDFYSIHGVSYSSHLYALYMNGAMPPFWTRFSRLVRENSIQVLDFLRWLGSVMLAPVMGEQITGGGSSIEIESRLSGACDADIIHIDTRGDTNSRHKRNEMYIDDIVLPKSDSEIVATSSL